MKKGNMNFLYTFVIGFIVVGMLSAMALQVLGETKDDMTGNSSEYNATAEVVDGMTNLTEKFPLIATIIGFVVIIGYFAYVKA